MKPGDVICLSASVPNREEWTEGSNPREIQEAIVSLARAVFSRGGRLLFGGHPSISPLIADIAGEYYSADPTRKIRPIVTFQSKLYEGKLPDRTWLLFRMGWSAIEWTPNVSGDKKQSLELMRRVMLGDDPPPEYEQVMAKHDLPPPLAMFTVGGMDGVREEALMFLAARRKWSSNRNSKIFALTSGGGASARFFDPPYLWSDCLWPKESVPQLEELALTQALQSGDLVPLEQAWESAHPNSLSSEFPVKPYAAITQWVLDEVL